MKLLIISHTPHYMQNGKPVGWGPTVREIDQLASLFESVIHIAVLYEEPPPQSSQGYQAKNVRFLPVSPSGGSTFRAKLGVLAAYPNYWKTIHTAISRLDDCDCIHVRCPANLSLLALLWLAVIRKPRYRWVKYAGNWQPAGAEPFSYKLQRKVLLRNYHRGIVTVSGKTKDQQPHVLSFVNPSMFAKDILLAQERVRKKTIHSPVQIAFVGTLNSSKGAGRALEIASMLQTLGFDFRLHMIGDGQERSQYEAWVRNQKLEQNIHFCGWMHHSELAFYYEQAHFNLLPSASEGWPKVLSEGMAYGVVPLAGAVSSVPQALEAFQTGKALDPYDLEAFVQAIQEYLAHPEVWKAESLAGLKAAEQFTYENYLHRVIDMFKNTWGIRLPAKK